MTELTTWVRQNPAAATTIGGAFIALCGVAISALVALMTARRSVYISSVTAERSKWIEKLRSNISDLLGLCSAIQLFRISGHSSEQEQQENIERLHQADRLVALITLQLNPSDENGIDGNLVNHLNAIVEKADKEGSSYRDEERKFIRHSQFMLKEEWEKVKAEARGPLMSFLSLNFCKRMRRRENYRKFRQSVLDDASSSQNEAENPYTVKVALLSNFVAFLFTSVILAIWYAVTYEHIMLVWVLLIPFVLISVVWLIDSGMVYFGFKGEKIELNLKPDAHQWAPISGASMIVGWSAFKTNFATQEGSLLILIGLLYSLWCIALAVDLRRAKRIRLGFYLFMSHLIVPAMIGLALASGANEITKPTQEDAMRAACYRARVALVENHCRPIRPLP